MAKRTARELIEDAKNYVGRVSEALKSANKAYKLITKDVQIAEQRLQFKESSTYPDTFGVSYANSMAASGTIAEMLKISIRNAAEINEEFSRGIYLDALLAVADDPDIYRIVPFGRGWATRINVSIAFESVAGRLEDWAHGIEGWRDALGIDLEEQGANRGLRATNWWYTKVYRKSLEVATFKGRIAYAGRPAPFWQILNSGSTSLPSDRSDGSYNPVPASPTDFIGEAEGQMEAHFNSVMRGEQRQWREETALLRDEVNRARELLADIESLIGKLKADDRLDNFIIEELSKRSKTGDIAQYVDKDKLKDAIRRYRAGEEFTTKTIELTAKNQANRRIRPRVETFVNLVEGYGEL